MQYGADWISTGVYDLAWKGGEFSVQLRANGVFYCRKFPAESTWSFIDGTLAIDWKKYGKYVLKPQADGSLKGSVLDKPEDWRTAKFVRARTAAEELVDASAWDISYAGGAPFRVEFHADGHFHSPDYPGHHLYTLDGNSLTINWGKFGTYDLTVDADARSASGHLRGNEASWRKLAYVEALPTTKSAHNHSH
jgi:hypothetical protein